MNSPATLDQLAERVTELERHNRWLRLGLAGLAVLGGLTLLTAAQQDKPRPIETTQLTMRDAAGTARVQMNVGDKGPMLQFLDAKGRSLATLGTADDALVLQYLTREGRPQTALALQKEGVAMIAFSPDGRLQPGRFAILQTGGVFTPK
jgi:hypothetical protein